MEGRIEGATCDEIALGASSGGAKQWAWLGGKLLLVLCLALGFWWFSGWWRVWWTFWSPGALKMLGLDLLALPLVPPVLFLLHARVTLVALLVLAWAVSAGALFLRLTRLWPNEGWEQGLFATATGLGLLALLTLGLGLMGWMNGWVLFMLGVACAIFGGRELGRLLRSARRRMGEGWRSRDLGTALWILMSLFLLMNLTRAFEPPWEYDVLEYHLAAPAKFHAAGRIYFLADNVYANFPQNVEMLYLICMRLSGSPEAGAAAGKLVMAVVGFLAACGVRRLGERIYHRKAGEVAAAIFFSWSAMTVYAGVEYVEVALTFYFVMTGLAIARNVSKRWGKNAGLLPSSGSQLSGFWASVSDNRDLLLAGLMAGFAAGCKYPAVLFLWAPVCIFLAVIAVLHPKGAFLGGGMFIAGAVAAFLPWALKNWIWTGNPTYPLLYSVFGSTNWDPVKDARWTQAHAPGEISIAAFIASMREFFCGTTYHSVTLLPMLFVPFLPCLRRGKLGLEGASIEMTPHRATLSLLVYVGSCCIFWFFLTHRIHRFLSPIMPALALLSGAGFLAFERIGRDAQVEKGHDIISRVSGWVLILLLLADPARLINYAHWDRSLDVFLGSVPPEEFVADPLRTDFSEGYRAMQFINQLGAEGEPVKVLFLGEARSFYCRVPHMASTVFDTHLLERSAASCENAEGLLRALRKEGITHLLVNTAELKRLQETYRFRHGGRERLGMLDGFNWALFGAFAEQYLEHLITFAGSGAESFPWEDWDQFRERTRGEVGGHFLALYALRKL